MGQFGAYKRNAAEEQRRTGQARDAAQAEADGDREAHWARELEAARRKAFKAASQSHAVSTEAAAEAHAAALQAQAATLAAQFTDRLRAREDALGAAGQHALANAVARAVAAANDDAAAAKVRRRCALECLDRRRYQRWHARPLYV